MDAVHKDKGIEWGQRTGLPFFHLGKDLIDNLADHLCRQFNPIELLQLVMDIPCAYVSCVQRDGFLLNAGDITLIFRKQLWFKLSVTVP